MRYTDGVRGESAPSPNPTPAPPHGGATGKKEETMNRDDAAATAAVINRIVGLASPPLRRPTAALVIAGAIMAPAMPPDVCPAAHDAFQRVVALLRIVERRLGGNDVAAAEIARAEAEALDCGVAARAAQRIAAEARP
jgi:hypothetical protein